MIIKMLFHMQLKQDTLNMKQYTLGRICFSVCKSHVKGRCLVGYMEGIARIQKGNALSKPLIAQEAQCAPADWHKVLCSHVVTTEGRKSG